jgi:hypothetical protein
MIFKIFLGKNTIKPFENLQSDEPKVDINP